MPETGVPVLRGLVLAGGASSRLGRDKAGVAYDGSTLLERAVALLGGLTAAVHVSVRDGQRDEPLRARFALVVDELDGCGPAAGLVAAHRLLPDSAWLVLACDMPQVTRSLLGRLVASRDPGRDATAFRAAADGLPEPLCAIYEPATLARFRALVEAGGDPSPRRWLGSQDIRLLDAPPARALDSINTPEELSRLGR